MHISRIGVFGGGQNNNYNNFAQKNPSMRAGAANKPRTDKLELSGQGKIAFMLESITEQKESIVLQKDELIKRTIAGGGKIDDVQEPLDLLNEKLQDLDNQAALLIESQTQMQIAALVSKQEETDAKTNTKELTQEEIDAKRLNSIAEISAEVKGNHNVVPAVKNQQKGAARVLSRHAKSDTLMADILLINAKVLAAQTNSSIPAAERASITRMKKNAGKKAVKAEKMLHNANTMDILIGKQSSESAKKIAESQKLEATKDGEKESKNTYA